MVIGFQIRKLHRGAESAPPPAVLDSKKPGLFRVKYTPKYSTSLKNNIAFQQFFIIPPIAVNNTNEDHTINMKKYVVIYIMRASKIYGIYLTFVAF